MNKLFYSIWRNRYLRSCIRNKQFQDIVIKINLKDLVIDISNNSNSKYLTLFTDKDKKDNRISIRLEIEVDQFNQYINSHYRDIVNDLVFIKKHNKSKVCLDCSQLPRDSLTRLSCYFDEYTVGGDNLPMSLTTLIINLRGYNIHGIKAVDQVLENLPPLLCKLSIPYKYQINNRVNLPHTLQDLCYSTNSKSSLTNISPSLSSTITKPFSNYEALVETLDDLYWYHDQQWISKLDVTTTAATPITHGMIPSHIKQLRLCHNGAIDDGALPDSLEWISIKTNIPVKRLPVLPHQLRFLYINDLAQQLSKGILPPTLELLHINKYNQPLMTDVLPNGLKVLRLDNFNQPIDTNVLPQSLKNLDLPCYNHELKPYVLPPNLQILRLKVHHQPNIYIQTISNK